MSMTRTKFPGYGLAGLFLVAVFWYLNWQGEGLRTHWMFFPLWLGYLLVIDGIAVWRGRQSLIAGNPKRTLSLFLVSIPLWWLFEWMNIRAQYWEYIPRNAFTPLVRALLKTLSFSTVVPAILITTNAVLSIPWFRQHHFRMRAARTSGGKALFLISGVVMLAAMLIWPQYGMAFMWISLFCMLSPVNAFLRNPSLMNSTARGDWRLVLALFAAALICGFFWELWNFHSWPKWIYTFPYLNGLKIFEMPLAGYLGYLPFSLEVWAITALLVPAIGRSLEKSIDAA